MRHVAFLCLVFVVVVWEARLMEPHFKNSSVADWLCTRCVLLYRSCYAVSVGSLPHGDELVIGLNPPFGKNNSLARAFVEQAARFRPSIIILIVPPLTPIPPGYIVDHEDVQTMAHK